MTLEKLFRKYLNQTKKQFDYEKVNVLCGCTDKKVVLTMAEAEAGQLTYDDFMAHHRWNDLEFGQGWLFGSPKTNTNIGLIPLKLSLERLGLNQQNWAAYKEF